MSNSKRLHFLFEVPHGLENVALRDVQESLPESLQPYASFIPEEGAGRLHMLCSSCELVSVVDQLKSVQLSSAQSITLIVSMVDMPSQVFKDGKKTCQFVHDATFSTNWHPSISTSIIGNANPIKFRATFKKEQLKHPERSQDLAGEVGFAFSKIFTDWKVDLTEYDFQVVTLWAQLSDSRLRQLVRQTVEEDNPIVLMLGLAIEIPDARYRNRKYFGRTSLNPCIAFCLARMADPQPGQLVLDMCCGTGTIPIEGAVRYPQSWWIGTEVRPKNVCVRALGNLIHSNLRNVELLLGDSRRLCMRDGVVDIVISDWPWGQREETFSAVQKLYPKFMREMGRVLKSNGKAYIVSQGKKLMNTVLAYKWCAAMWSIDSVQPIEIGGYRVTLYVLTKSQG